MNLEDIFALDFAYRSTYTKKIERDWGTLFFNENQPTYYDANHAHISESSPKPERVVHEVMAFYEEKSIVPRFFIYNVEKQQGLLKVLEARGFRDEELISPVQIWNAQSNIKENKSSVTVEVVTDENYEEALAIEASIKEFGGKETVEKFFYEQFHHPMFTHYLLRENGIACATACLYADGNQARIESVATAEEFRGKGLVGEIIRFIQKETLARGINKLWIFPINERVEKIYEKYGFQSVGQVKMVHAFLSGKGIKEIQGA